jgi:heptosyltransferase-2
MTIAQMRGNLKRLVTSWSLEAARRWRVMRKYRLSSGILGATLLRAVSRHNAATDRQPDDLPKKILVVRLDALGDLVMTTQVFRELKKYYPDSKLTAVVQERTKDILEANPYVDRILCPPTPHRARLLLGFRRELSVVQLYWKFLRKEHFDVALHPRFGPDYFAANLLMKLVDAPISVKYIDDWHRGLARQIDAHAFRSMTNLPRPPVQHEVLTNAAGIEYLTGQTSTSRPEIFLTAEDRLFAMRVVGSSKPHLNVIGVGFGAQEKRRRWPLERWAEVIRLLANKRALFIVVICSGAERASGELLQSMLPVESRLVSGARVREAAACIEACDLFMGPDSGPAHVAAAVGCWPLTVSPHPLDGAVDYSSSPGLWAPYCENGRVIQPATAIPPCSEGCDAVEPHCILQILPEPVAQACEVMLRSIGQNTTRMRSM